MAHTDRGPPGVEKHRTDPDADNVERGSEMAVDQNDVTTAEDPTKAVLSKSGLNSKHLCDYVVNVATGCRHGCKFCYVPSTPNIRTRPEMLEREVEVENAQKEWGNYVLYRDDLGGRLEKHLSRKRSWDRSEKGCGIVGISFSTDCYMDGRAGRITRDVVDALSSHEKYGRVLTRNPILALQDIDVFKDAGQYATIGSSIPSLNEEEVHAIEPRAPSPDHRLRGLKEFNETGVNTYVSMSPTYPTTDRDELKALMERISEADPSVVFHEPINPRGSNFDMTVEAAREAGQDNLVRELVDMKDRDYWIRYAVTHLKWVQEIGEDLNLPIHLWPDKQLVSSTGGTVSEWLQHWRERQSPEEFAERNTPSEEPMDPPSDGEISRLSQ